MELLLEIRQEMAHEADYDVELFAELARHGSEAAARGKGKRLTIPRTPSSGASDVEPLRLDKGAVT